MLVYTVYRKTVRIKSENILKLLRKSRAFNYKFKIIYQGRQSVPKSGRSERGGARNFGVYQTTSPWTGAFCLEILGRGRKIGSAYALVDLVTLEPLSYILVMLSALDYQNSFCHSLPYFNTYLPSIMCTWYYMYIYNLS